MPSLLRLVLPEWQGFGRHADVHRGATRLAAALFNGENAMTIHAPVDEALRVSGGVLGLDSIAPRFDETLDVIERHAPDRLVTVGGTCGVELAPVAYLNARAGGALTVLWLDAHADLNTPASSPSGHFHGMALRTLTGDGPAVLTRRIAPPLTPGQIVLVGARDLDPPEADHLAREGISRAGDEVFDAPERLVRALSTRGAGRLYVHVDVDVLDPATFHSALMHAPGGGPSPGGLGALVRALDAAFDIVGLSVLEFCDRGRADDLEAIVQAVGGVTRSMGRRAAG